MEFETYFRAVEAIMDEYDGRPHWGKRHYQTAATLRPRYPEWDRFTEIRDTLRSRSGGSRTTTCAACSRAAAQRAVHRELAAVLGLGEHAQAEAALAVDLPAAHDAGERDGTATAAGGRQVDEALHTPAADHHVRVRSSERLEPCTLIRRSLRKQLPRAGRPSGPTA